MNFFAKNRLLSWILMFLVVINLAALVSFFFFTGRQPDQPACCSEQEQ